MVGLDVTVNRRVTEAFIAADPVIVALTRVVRTPTAAGGYLDAPVAVPEQIFRLIPKSGGGDGGSEAERETDDGSAAYANYVLLGKWDADLQRGDKFVRGNVEFEVIGPISPLHTDNAYEKKAEVISRGRR